MCIVSNAEGLAENVQHKETAWVIPKRDSECIANQVINILLIIFPGHGNTEQGMKLKGQHLMVV